MKISAGSALAFMFLLVASASGLLPAPPVPFDGPSELKPFTTEAFLAPDRIEATRFGLQLFAASPELDLRSLTGQTGFGASAFLEKQLYETTVIQAHLDYINYRQIQNITTPNGYPFVPGNSQTLAADSTALGVDLKLYPPLGGLKGLYLSAGLAAMRYEFKTTYSGGVDQNGIPLAGLSSFKDKTSTKAAWDLGFGYDLNDSWGLAAKYTSMTIDSTTLATAQAGLTYRF